ncbi:MAG TPA: hypothetical protein VE777_15745 [Gaiellales bacterium]|nr:hypothetical protein [Gaiellales bacterium]
MGRGSRGLRVVGRLVAALAAAALARGLYSSPGTTQIGTWHTGAVYLPEARHLFTAVAIVVGLTGILAARMTRTRPTLAAVAVIAVSGAAALGEVYRCLGHWNDVTIRAAVAAGRPASAVHNRIGAGVELVSLGGALALVTAAIFAAAAFPRPAD